MKKRIIIISSILVIIAVSILCILLNAKNRPLSCQINNELLEGFNNQENIKIYLKKNTINKIQYDRTIKLNDFYQEYGNYQETLEKVFETSYEYIDNKKITKDEKQIAVSFALQKDGIILSNIKIKYNSNADKTSLRYDIEDYATSKEKSLKINDKYKRKELKKYMLDNGYTCK